MHCPCGWYIVQGHTKIFTCFLTDWECYTVKGHSETFIWQRILTNRTYTIPVDVILFKDQPQPLPDYVFLLSGDAIMFKVTVKLSPDCVYSLRGHALSLWMLYCSRTNHNFYLFSYRLGMLYCSRTHCNLYLSMYSYLVRKLYHSRSQ